MVNAAIGTMGSATEVSQCFNRLLRFEDNEGKVCYGDLPLDCAIVDAVGMIIPVLEGNPFDGLKVSHNVAQIKKVRNIPSHSLCSST